MGRVYGKVDRYLEGQTVFVIGGGPSLGGFDFAALQDRNTIGANDAGRLSGSQAVVTLDRNYYRHRWSDLEAVARDGRRVFVALPPDVDGVPFPPEITFLYFHRGSGKGLSCKPDVIHGLNSGYAALNVAFLAGAKDIRLLGFDFRFKRNAQHWHPDHFWHKQSNDHQIRRWARDFDLTTNQLAREGVTVTNYVGPGGSEIAAFETRPLEEALQ